jgi:uncharacterized SAM-binding protein YcdF (DUF218 family)
MIDEVDQLAKTIWDYMLMEQPLQKCDAILVLCSIDERVAEYAAQLFLDGHGDYLVFSGGVAHGEDLLKVTWEGSEAEHFANIAIRTGVSKDKILIENHAQNTGANIQLTYTLLRERDLRPTSLLLIQKPYMERRTYAAFKKQWPEEETDIIVSSPHTKYEDYFNQANPKDVVINIMVGDLQRIRGYPKLGFQIEQEIPAQVWKAYEQLVDLGYTQHLMQL